MITIVLNGKQQEIDPGCSVRDVLARLTSREITDAGTAADGGRLGIAVVLNKNVLPRSRWAAQGLNEADDVEVVTAVQGG